MRFISAWTLGAICALATTAALAQVYPLQNGPGVERGISEQNTSGQVGTATLFNRGSSTVIVLNIKSVPPGKTEPAELHRTPSQTCDSYEPQIVYVLKPVVNGASRSTVPAPIAKLLSGNYVVIVRSAEKPEHAFSCGHLYLN